MSLVLGGQGDLGKLPFLDWDADRPTGSSHMRSSTNRCANFTFRSQFEETPSPIGLAAAASKDSSPLHPELLEICHQAESVLVRIQHLFYGHGSIEWNVHDDLGGPIPHIRKGQLLGNTSRS